MSKPTKQQKKLTTIKLVKLKFIKNGNITNKHLRRCGLHLNRNGNIIFVKNVLNAIKKLM